MARKKPMAVTAIFQCDCLLVFLLSPVLIRLPAYFFHQLGELHQIWDVSLMDGFGFRLHLPLFGKGFTFKSWKRHSVFCWERRWRWVKVMTSFGRLIHWCPQEISRFVCSKFKKIRRFVDLPKLQVLALGWWRLVFWKLSGSKPQIPPPASSWQEKNVQNSQAILHGSHVFSCSWTTPNFFHTGLKKFTVNKTSISSGRTFTLLGE